MLTTTGGGVSVGGAGGQGKQSPIRRLVVEGV